MSVSQVPQPESSKEFWASFVSEHWERRPLALGDAPVGLGMDAEEAFDLTVAAFSHPESECRFFANGMQLFADIKDLWPCTTDHNWDGFSARMDETLGDVDYLLIANHIQALDFSVFDRARSFLYGLHCAGVGLPSDFADVDIIAGRYVSTPHGVHKDPGGSFMAGLKGEKAMVTWSGADDRIKEFTRRYDQWRDEATVLAIPEGSLVYWPSSAWHVGESPVDLSVSASVAMYVGSDPLLDVSGIVRSLVESGPTGTYPWCSQIPEELKSAGRALTTAAESAEFAIALQEAWLTYYTAGGFVSPPEPEGARADVGKGTPIRIADRRFPIAVASVPGGEKIFSANGQSWRTSASDTQVKLVERLNSGEAVTDVGVDISSLVDRLLACQAVVPVS